MKIKFLGTAAAEGVPAIYCECDTCKRARELGGKEIRTRSQSIINGELMLDFPADTYWHSMQYGIDLKDVHHYLITHTHGDHFHSDDMSMLCPGWGKLSEGTAPYHFCGGKEMAEKIQDAKNLAGERMVVHTLEPFKTYDIGGYKVTPLKAYHGTETPFIYIIEKDGKTLFYTHDTGLFVEETWEYLKENKPHFDFVSWDCCSGNEDEINYFSHLCMGYIRNIRAEFEKIGITDDKTIHCVNHFSHLGKSVLYEDREIYEKQGYIMSYDGMEVEF